MTTETMSTTVVVCGMTLTTIVFAALVTLAAGIPTAPVVESNALHYVRTLNAKQMIVDVDAGADDALGLILALTNKSPDTPNIIAITTSHGNANVSQVTINVLRTLRELKKSIPVYIGSYSSLTTTPTGDHFYGLDGFGDMDVEDPPSLEEAEKEHAVSAMVRLVAENPGKITMVVLGPMTNVALATRMDPHFRKNLKSLVWMGGSIQGVGNTRPGIEFNSYMDPEANFIVFNTSGCPVVMFPWETCIHRCVASKQWRLDVLGRVDSPIIQFLNGIENKSFKSNKWATCDSKTVAMLLDPNFVTKAIRHNVIPVTQGEGRGGLLVDYEDKTTAPKNAIIVMEADVERFKAMCLKNLS